MGRSDDLGRSVSAYEFSGRARDMLNERKIRESWVKLVVEDSERKEPKDDGTIHYIRAVEEFGGRYLRVVLDPNVEPQKIVTLFFDRRLGS